MLTALALSPHLDDAAFSAGGTIATLALKGWSVTVATVFTASVPDPQGFALACQLDKGLPPDVDYMALRREEDLAACEHLGASPRWLGLPEAPHRGYNSAPALFGPLRPDDRLELTGLLDATIRAIAPDVLLAPQSLGGHVDHLQLGLALRSIALVPPCILWWRDFPYAARERVLEPFACEMRTMPEFAVSLAPGALTRRQDACLVYRSQVGFQFGGAEGLRCLRQAEGGSERFRIVGETPW